MSIKLKKYILEAIDQLRGRKARPDVDRICNHLQRRYNVGPKDTIADLQKLVDHEFVIRVEYKGSTSYRNAAKWPRYNLGKNKHDAASLILMSASDRTLKILNSALMELLKRNSQYHHDGVPYEEIQNLLIQNDDLLRFKDNDYLDAIIALEMNHGNVHMLENGNFIPESRVTSDINVTVDGKECKVSLPPKKIIKPWMLEELKKEMGFAKSTSDKNAVGYPSLVPVSNPKVMTILTMCKALRDAETKKMNKRVKDKLKMSRNIDLKTPVTSPTAAEAEVPPVEGASLSTGGKSPVTASRVGSRCKRARQVFDPSDNNLPRNRNKRARLLANHSNSKQLQQHVLQHQTLLRMHNQKTVHATTTSAQASPEKDKAGEQTKPEQPIPSSSKSPKPNRLSPGPKPKAKPKLLPPPVRSPSPAPPPSVTPSSISETSETSNTCILCKGDFSIKAVRTIYCQSCDAKVHRVCLKNLQDQTIQPPLNPRVKWQCMECRLCTVCNKSRVDKHEWILVCQICDDAYHASCHAPSMLHKPSIKWICYRCTVEKSVAMGENKVNYSDKYPAASVPIIHTPTKLLNMNGDFPDNNSAVLNNDKGTEEFSNVHKWSCEQVVTYFTAQGFEEEMSVFKEQEIDGKSLLLMRRMDVLRGLGLKLGPALKIHSHIARMQHCHFSAVPS